MSCSFKSIVVLIGLSVGLFPFNVLSANDHILQLHPELQLKWKILNNENIQFDLTSSAPGYIGIGISTQGSMVKADIVICGFLPNGQPYLHDYHGPAEGNGRPLLDHVNNYNLLKASNNGTHRHFTFTRKLQTCDIEEDIEITQSSLKLIWALGASDELTQHVMNNRGVKEVRFIQGDAPILNLSEYLYHDIKSVVKISPDPTIYWCSHHSPGTEDPENLHYIAFEAILGTPEAVKYTHHMVLMDCRNSSLEELKLLSSTFWTNKTTIYPENPGAVCYSENNKLNNINKDGCYTFQLGWGKGGEIFQMPENISRSLKGNGVYRLEIHIDNPELDDNIEIEVGFRIYYSKQPKEHQAGALIVGAIVNYNFMIPPNSKNFLLASGCVPECFNFSSFPAKGVTIYSAFPHSHISGRKIRLRHFRKGKELPMIINEESYDFDYQQNILLAKPVTLLKEDQLLAECEYNTIWKNGSAVLGGYSTKDEMCLVFLEYYPQIQDFHGCQSFLDTTELFRFFQLKEQRTYMHPLNHMVEKLEEGAKVTKPFSTIVEEFDWTPEKRSDYQNLQLNGKHTVMCSPSSHLTPLYPESYKLHPVSESSFCKANEILEWIKTLYDGILLRNLY